MLQVSRSLLALLAAAGIAALSGLVPLRAEPVAYRLANTATLAREGGEIVVEPTSFDQRLVHIDLSDDGGELTLDIGTPLKLWRIPSGLAHIEWPVETGITLAREDIPAITGQPTLAEVPTWGAEVDWPELGPVTLVLFELDTETYAGMLSSTPSGVRKLRQMIFRQMTVRNRPQDRPAHRARPSPSALAD
ncbi:hypothetical protein [Stappia sp.]|uniref:hypothetical protein n=1 Tax=Stappia sp. TaxID=1870903 RepID=UPI003A99108B